MAAAQQHQFDGLSIAEIVSAVQQHQFEFDGSTKAEVEEMEIWRHRGVMIAEAEEVLRHKKSWCNLMAKLFIIFMGVYLIIRGAITPGLTRADWITIGIISCILFVIGVGLFCWDAYVRTQMEHFLAFMQLVSDALDLESAGQLAATTDHQQLD